MDLQIVTKYLANVNLNDVTLITSVVQTTTFETLVILFFTTLFTMQSWCPFDL